ncbi:MAG TPA: hypothetical protein VK588_10750 [Chitinophagaceae bacterium]|nr:hypothetical protein [Chitinophagaceae bacterium]
MKTRNIILVFVLVFLLAGCTHAITPFQAASGNYHHCRPLH